MRSFALGGTIVDWTKALDLVRVLPIWLLATIAVTGGIVLFAPPFASLDFTEARKWPWLSAAFVFASVSVGLRLVDQAWRAAVKWRERRPKPTLKITLDPSIATTFWSPATVAGAAATQVYVKGNVLNTSEGLVRIVSARLVRPRIREEDTLPGMTVVSDPAGGKVYSSEHPVRPRGLSKFSVTLFVKGPNPKPGQFWPVTIELVDHAGLRHRFTVRLWPPPEPVAGP